MPAGMRNALTPDDGEEFAARKSLSQALAPDVYVTRPYAHGRGVLTNMPMG
jgi:IS30 family transposase